MEGGLEKEGVRHLAIKTNSVWRSSFVIFLGWASIVSLLRPLEGLAVMVSSWIKLQPLSVDKNASELFWYVVELFGLSDEIFRVRSLWWTWSGE